MAEGKDEETGLLLVASLIGELQKQVLQVNGEVRSLAGRLDVQTEKLDAIHSEVKRTNGRVTEIETWRDGLQDEAEQAAAYQAGLDKRKADERKVAGGIWRAVLPYLRILGLALAAGAGARIAAFFVGGWW